jgi:hypothetical protein
MGSSIGYMIRDFLHRSDVPFEWIELADDEDARRLAGVTSLNDSRLPVCVFPMAPEWNVPPYSTGRGARSSFQRRAGHYEGHQWLGSIGGR